MTNPGKTFAYLTEVKNIFAILTEWVKMSNQNIFSCTTTIMCHSSQIYVACYKPMQHSRKVLVVTGQFEVME